jgi:hypothetical protein
LTKKNILLVEPGYKAIYPPLGLMKISTYHKQKGDYVDFIKHTSIQMQNSLFEKEIDFDKSYNPYKKKYDIIYITTLFTYYYKEVVDAINFYKNKFPEAEIKVGGILASIMPKNIEKDTGIKPHVGLLNKDSKIEYCQPDYSLFPNIDYSITFTTRGCENNCAFCAVKIHEPKFFVRKNWEKDINLMHNRIVFWDNNWFCSPNIHKDIETIKGLKEKGITNIDFNQGLDCRLFTRKMAEAIKDLPISPLRFAFDNHSEDKHIQDAIKLAHEYGFKDVRVYVLYNFNSKNDTPEYFYYRINEVNKLGALSYPMRYRPLEAVNMHQCYNFISNNWTRELLRALKLTLMFYYSDGMISKKRESFLKIYGKNEQEFVKKLNKIYENDKKKGEKHAKTKKRK